MSGGPEGTGGSLEVLRVFGGCWSGSHGIVVGNRGEVGAVPEQRSGRSGDSDRKSDGILKGVRYVLETV